MGTHIGDDKKLGSLCAFGSYERLFRGGTEDTYREILIVFDFILICNRGKCRWLEKVCRGTICSRIPNSQ